MRTIQIENKKETLFHIIFWICSVNFWNIINKPVVDQTLALLNWQYGIVLLLNLLFLIYCLSLGIWFIRNISLAWKISLTVVFIAIPLFYYFQDFEYINKYLDIKRDSGYLLIASVLNLK